MGRSRGRGRRERICTHIIMAHNNVCTKLRTTVYGGGRGLRGPVGVGWCACDKTNTVNHVHAHLVGLGGVCRGSVHYMHSASEAIGPGGWGQRPRR